MSAIGVELTGAPQNKGMKLRMGSRFDERFDEQRLK